MATIPAQDMFIEVEESYWRVYQESDSAYPVLLFEALHGSKVLQYKSTYGQAIGLPGNRLAVTYVRAVVIGYDQKNLNWLLGLHVSDDPDKKPRWVPLVRWESGPNQRYAAEVQKAGRILAEYVGRPLKIFGIKKVPTTRPTGPLEQHQRTDVDPYEVERVASRVKLPIEQQGMWLGPGRSGEGLTLRVQKHAPASQAGEIAPAYQMCEIDTRKGSVKLVPPTGLLGSIFGGVRGREISFGEIRNIEFRYVIETLSSTQEETDDGMLLETSTTRRSWRIYLTLRDESLLLAQTSHSVTSELTRRSAQDAGDTSRVEGFHRNVDYYRQLEEDQKAREEARQWATMAAYVMAWMTERPLVATQIGSEIG